MSIPLRCTCGAFQGEVDPAPTYARARCYCKDCQAYAHHLGNAGQILDSHGGTDIVATLPAAVRITAGLEQLACLTLTAKGPLRWYAACCRTPIGNTARDHKTPYLGIVGRSLSAPASELDAAFGPASIALNTGSARGGVASTPVATFLGVLQIMGHALIARMAGRHKVTPFFDTTSGKPVKAPQALSAEQRQAAYRDLN